MSDFGTFVLTASFGAIISAIVGGGSAWIVAKANGKNADALAEKNAKSAEALAEKNAKSAEALAEKNAKNARLLARATARSALAHATRTSLQNARQEKQNESRSLARERRKEQLIARAAAEDLFRRIASSSFDFDTVLDEAVLVGRDVANAFGDASFAQELVQTSFAPTVSMVREAKNFKAGPVVKAWAHFRSFDNEMWRSIDELTRLGGIPVVKVEMPAAVTKQQAEFRERFRKAAEELAAENQAVDPGGKPPPQDDGSGVRG